MFNFVKFLKHFQVHIFTGFLTGLLLLLLIATVVILIRFGNLTRLMMIVEDLEVTYPLKKKAK